MPAYFSTLNKGKITLYIKKEYEDRLSSQDMDRLFNLCKDASVRSDHVRRQVSGNTLRVAYHGRTPCRTLVLESLDNTSLVVRDYWHGGLFGKVLRDFFWDSLRPLRELKICEAARNGGVDTTEIVAIVRDNIIGPLYKCQLISKEIINSIDLMEFLLQPEVNQLLTQKRHIINKMARAVRDMHDAGIYHADLHLKNILVQLTAGGVVEVYIIDLDKSEQYETLGFHTRMKNIMRLDRSLEKLKRSSGKDLPVTNADKLRFLREYIKLSYKQKPNASISRKEFLKSCLIDYQTTHKAHRFWWFLVSGK